MPTETNAKVLARDAKSLGILFVELQPLRLTSVMATYDGDVELEQVAEPGLGQLPVSPVDDSRTDIDAVFRDQWTHHDGDIEYAGDIVNPQRFRCESGDGGSTSLRWGWKSSTRPFQAQVQTMKSRLKLMSSMRWRDFLALSNGFDETIAPSPLPGLRGLRSATTDAPLSASIAIARWA